MNFFNISTVARYEAKILKRSWLFRILALISLVGIVFFQTMMQGNLANWVSWNMIAMSSYVPYLNVYLFGMVMAITVVFLGGELLSRDRKLDSMEIIYARPMSNADYVVGKAWGIIRVFMGLALISLIIGGIINLFFSDALFDGFLYLFYWLVFLFPSLVFILGLVFFISSVIRNKAITIFFSLGYLFLTIFYLAGSNQGLYDFLASSIPSVYSDLTGFFDLGSVLLQRFTWFFIGMGFIGYSVVLLRRIPNRPNGRGVQSGFSGLFVITGIVCGGILYFSGYQDKNIRTEYRVSYEKYNPKDKLTLDNQEITYRQSGDRIEVATRLKLLNNHDKEVASVILYLNPGLEVKRLTKGNRELSYTRDNQVIEIKESVQPGDGLFLTMEYAGKIDESVCYLDIEDKYVYNNYTTGSALFRTGKRYAFAEKDYTLLTPECLWYPVSIPPINIKNVYDIQKNFTDYRLKLLGMENRTVISQGARESSGDTLIFQDEHRLTGLSLCIGNYKLYSVTADSVSFELYIKEGHDDFISGFTEMQDSMVSVLSDLKFKAERNKNCEYPYNRFMIVESPASFVSYYRNGWGGSERIQPEIAFLPERGIGFWSMNFKKTLEVQSKMHKMNNAEVSMYNMENIVFGQFVQNAFMSKYGSYNERNPFMRLFASPKIMSGFALNGNQYDISSLFAGYVTYIYSPQYPIMNTVMNSFLKPQGWQESSYSTYSTSYNKALDYLKNHSLKDALEDAELTSDVLYQIINLKATTLQIQYFALTINPDLFKEFINDYFERHKYEQVEFVHFNEEFVRQFGINWLDVLSDWYTINKVPSFILQDCFIEMVEDNEKELDRSQRYRIHASVFNDSDIDGVISISYSMIPDMKGKTFMMAFNSDEMRNRVKYVLVESGKAKEITVLCDGQIAQASINTNISENLPATFALLQYGVLRKTREISSGVKDIDSFRFLPKEGELIVDNESQGFRVLQSTSGNQLRKWFRSDNADEYKTSAYYVSSEKWEPILADGFYGEHIRSGWMKMAGNGSSEVEWSTRIDTSGYYEVFAYLPNMTPLVRPKLSGNVVFSGQKSSLVKQYYIICNDGKETEIEVEIPSIQREWVSLGRFYFSAGDASVVLTDKGNVADQVVCADAVKWVFDEEKKD